MSDTEIDTATATPEVGSAVGTGATGGAPPSPTDILHDDLGADDSELDGGEGDASDAESSSGEPADDGSRPAWRRPEGLEGEALAEWKETQGLPVDADGYEIDLDLQEGQTITESGQQLLEGLKAFCVENDVPAPTLNSLARWYKQQTEAQQTRLIEGDQQATTRAREALSKTWGSDDAYKANIATIREFLGDAKRVPSEFAKAIASARAADGQRLINNPTFAAMLLRLAQPQNATRPAKGRTNVTEELKAELAELTAVRDRDVSELYRPWRGTGKSGSDRMLEITRQLDSAATQARHAADRDAGSDEERELLALHRNDPQFFQFGRWKDSAISPADRLYQLRAGRR